MNLEVRLFGQKIGLLSDETVNGVAVFEFQKEYSGHNPSPFALQKRDGLIAPTNPLKGVHGCFADSLPDYFGDGAMDQWFRQKGLIPDQVSSLQRLGYVGDRGMGAFEYFPDLGASDGDFIKALDEIYLERCARAVTEGDADSIPGEFLKAASSLGGARPKLTIGINPKDPSKIVLGNWRLRSEYEPWILKVDVSPEKHYGQIEHAFLIMAARAGIQTSPSRVICLKEEKIDHHHFATKRFDRSGSDKLHCHSLAGLLERDFTRNETTYKELLIVAKRLTSDIQVSKEFLQRAIFNYLARNCDDHAKNHGFVMDPKGVWNASPAYDLTPSAGEGRRGIHAMLVNEGIGSEPTLMEWQNLGAEIGIKKSEVTDMYDRVKTAISTWDQIADEAHIPERRRKEIAQLFL